MMITNFQVKTDSTWDRIWPTTDILSYLLHFIRDRSTPHVLKIAVRLARIAKTILLIHLKAFSKETIESLFSLKRSWSPDQFERFQIWSNVIQHVATYRNRVVKRMQHVVPNNVARCCVEMLRAFGQTLRLFLPSKSLSWLKRNETLPITGNFRY